MNSWAGRERVVAQVLLALFGVLFCVESLGNHYLFRTFGLDLGLYTNTLYDHAHLRDNDGTFFLPQPSSQMGGHFDLYLWLLSPLVYLFGGYTLLLVQVAAVLAGMWGVYRLTRLYSESAVVPLAAMLMLGLSFGVWHALAFDYHSGVVAAMLLPWLLYHARCENRRGVLLLSAAVAAAGELSALWVVFVMVALLFDHWRCKPMRRTLAAAAAGAALYFGVVALLVMPALGGGGGTGFWRYDWMGGSLGEVALWLASHPLRALQCLFVDFTGGATGVKAEFYICLLLSGGLFCLAKPNYLLMLLPALFVKMLARDPFAFWGIANHYNAEICVAAVCAVGPALAGLKQARLSAAAAVVGTALAASSLVYTVGTPKAFILPDNVRVLSAGHYRQPAFDADKARSMLSQIPGRASVCASTMFTPHLALRDSVYLFPEGMVHSPEYVMLLTSGADAQKTIGDTVHYRVVDCDASLCLLRRND